MAQAPRYTPNPVPDNPEDLPKYIFEEIKQYIPKDKLISMPFYGDGTCANHLREMGFKVYHEQEDFFKNDRGDIVVDNPPFEFKKKIIETLVERKKPFMLIMPVSTLCYNYSRVLGKDLQMLIPNKRPKFIYYDKFENKNRKNLVGFFLYHNLNKKFIKNFVLMIAT